MIGAGAVLLLGAAIFKAGGSVPVCPAAAVADGPGVVDPFHLPAAAAAQLNADGKILYRQGRWDDARRKYRAAEAADPEFLAPALNVACSFVRQERYGEALSETLRLIGRAYLPWSQEVLSAADLGALKARGEGSQLRAGLLAARERWAEGLTNDVILVARLRPPLKLDDTGAAVPTPTPPFEAAATVGTRALVLGQRQEVFAWSPRTRRYRQLTSEEGRVLALLRSPNGQSIAYVTAEKLIRAPGNAAAALRGVVATELDLRTLTVRERGSFGADVRGVDILVTATGFAYRVDQGPGGGVATFALAGGGFRPRAPARAQMAKVTLTGKGVAAAARPLPLPGQGSGCLGDLRDVRAPGAVPAVRVTGAGRNRITPFTIGGPHGAGLFGLPIL